jgi:hypothetical protein
MVKIEFILLADQKMILRSYIAIAVPKEEEYNYPRGRKELHDLQEQW